MKVNNVHCQLEVYELTTSLGPAATDHFPDPVLIVSEETEPGGQQVLEERKRRGLEDMALIVVGLVTDSDGEKLSSTRMRSLECSAEESELKYL